MKTYKPDSYYIAEPPTDPPEDTPHIIAGCGHEVYQDEEVFDWTERKDGEEITKTLCPDCMEDKFKEMPLTERAELLGCEHQTANFK